MAELLPFQKLQKQLTAFIRDPDNQPMPQNVDPERANIYKELLFNNLLETIGNALPVCKEILSKQDFNYLVRSFFKDVRTQSPYFHDIPKAFIEYLNQQDLPKHYPPFLQELAHYEWAELALEIFISDVIENDLNIPGDLVHESPVISSYAWLLQYQFEVHKIGINYQPEKPPAEPTFLVIYRNNHDTVAFMKVSLLTAHLIHLLSEHGDLSGNQALIQLAEAIKPPDIDGFIQAGLNDLTTLQQQSIILGTRRLT